MRNMTIKEFLDEFKKVANECSADGENVNSHHGIKSTVKVCVYDDSNGVCYSDYEIVEISFDSMMGCGCWSDVVIKVKKIKEENT